MISNDFDTEAGFNDNLFDFTTGAIQPLGEDFADYVTKQVVPSVDLFTGHMQVDPIILTHGTASLPHREVVRVRIGNRGGVAAHDVVAQFWFGNPRKGGTVLGTSATISSIRPACRDMATLEWAWTPPALAPGVYEIFVQLQSANAALETNAEDNIFSQQLLVMNQPLADFIYLPLIIHMDACHIFEAAQTGPYTILDQASKKWSAPNTYK